MEPELSKQDILCAIVKLKKIRSVLITYLAHYYY